MRRPEDAQPWDAWQGKVPAQRHDYAPEFIRRYRFVLAKGHIKGGREQVLRLVTVEEEHLNAHARKIVALEAGAQFPSASLGHNRQKRVGPTAAPPSRHALDEFFR
jgi:hypothetical protein